MQKNIDEIDNALTKLFDDLTALTEHIELHEIAEFHLNEAEAKTLCSDLSYPGIYLIEIKNNGQHATFKDWIAHFKSLWEDERFVGTHCPKLIKKRIEAHLELQKWMPLYIGTSENVGKRIKEHLYKELHQSTYALKLMARDNLKQELFRLSTYPVKVDNYEAIMPRMERQLREDLKPLIGKQ